MRSLNKNCPFVNKSNSCVKSVNKNKQLAGLFIFKTTRSTFV